MNEASKIKLAKQLVKLAKLLVENNDKNKTAQAGNQGKSFLMGKGPYHNNPSNIDAIVPNRYQGQFEVKNKNKIISLGIPLNDYLYVLSNFESIFLNATQQIGSAGRTTSYDNKFFGTDINIENRQYHIKIHVLMPTAIQIERSKKNPDPNNNEAVPKIKWIFMQKK